MTDSDSIEQTLAEKKLRFIDQLKLTYTELYSALKPIPGCNEKTYSIESLFVEGGIEKLDDDVGRNIWIPLESHQHMLSDRRLESKKRILEAEAGYGKTTLTLQLAYEWCNNVDNSSIKGYEILIMLKLGQLLSVRSFLDAIKATLLPKDFKIDSKDIGDIVDTARSVVVVLDDIDEYIDNNEHIPKDILNIIERHPRLDLILTSRPYIDEHIASKTKRIRLTGFNVDAQDKYLDKVLPGNGSTGANNVKHVIHYNPVLRDICQVPSFFVLFAHLSQTIKELSDYKSITSFFRYIIDSLHLKGKMGPHEVEHIKLNRIAFESLSGNSRRRSWRKDELLERIGEGALEHYLQAGILQEETFHKFSDKPLSASNRDYIKSIQYVRFYHDLLCEWYAAHYLVQELLSPGNIDEDDVIDILDELDHVNLQYVYRFACGINSSAANYIISYFRNLNRCEEIIIMCILEQSDSVDIIIDVMEEICSKFLQISTKNNRALNKATIQLMETAASNKIDISSLLLSDCFQAVDMSRNMLILSSGLQLPTLATLHELHITQTGREFTEDEMTDIFIYISNSNKIKTVKFTDCLLPAIFKNKIHLEKLKEREAKVFWYPLISWYRLNLISGCWQEKLGSFILQEKDYERKVATFRDIYKEV